MTLENETDLTGKAAFVSGASSGIGRAIAKALGAEGARVTLCARRRERLEAVAEEIREAGGEAHVETADFLQVNEIDSAILGAADHWGGELDILISSAGIGRQAMLMDGDTQDWREMMDLNVLALAVASREALKHFPGSGGHIVNISSLSGHRVPGGGFYSATKFAVRALTEGLRRELRSAGNPTRVSSVSPGFVDTELLDIYFRPGSGGVAKSDVIDYEILKPEEVAAVVIRQLTLPASVEVTDVLMRPTAQVV